MKTFFFFLKCRQECTIKKNNYKMAPHKRPRGSVALILKNYKNKFDLLAHLNDIHKIPVEGSVNKPLTPNCDAKLHRTTLIRNRICSAITLKSVGASVNLIKR